MDARDCRQKTISLVVKTPNQTQEDHTVDGVQLTWTVRDLKTHLSLLHPTKPAVSEQLLIYTGKLLPDHLHIKDLFRQTDSTPTLHLVCSSRSPPHRPLGARPKTKEAQQRHSSSHTSVPATASVVQTPSSPELRQRRPTCSAAAAAHTTAPPLQTPAWPAATMHGAPQMTQPVFPTHSLYSPQQLLWLQYLYARQYYMQYHAALAASGSVPSTPAATVSQYPPVPAHQVPVPAPIANQNPINNLPPNQNPVQDAAFMNPEDGNQDMRMNVQGGPVVEDEDGVERDWLDWLYSASRLGVLLMIVYFNSNLSHFLLVMSTLLLMYLYTAGLFPYRRQAQPQGPNHLQPPEVQNNHQNENRNPNLNPADEAADGQREAPTAESEGPERPMMAVLVPPHRVSVMWTVWVFFKTFFSSLIPEGPQAMAN
ncbi:homocysteine-responsive endoplasmic reticulum-resident ubiquitin-like domain member 1 protein isoform 2-T2 [Pholidichthys leucotaenia]